MSGSDTTRAIELIIVNRPAIRYFKCKMYFYVMFRKIARDKWKHFFVGIPLGAALQASAWYILPAELALATILAFIVLLVICYGFELFSHVTGKGHYELWDAIAGVLGGIIGMAGALYMILPF